MTVAEPNALSPKRNTIGIKRTIKLPKFANNNQPTKPDIKDAKKIVKKPLKPVLKEILNKSQNEKCNKGGTSISPIGSHLALHILQKCILPGLTVHLLHHFLPHLTHLQCKVNFREVRNYFLNIRH